MRFQFSTALADALPACDLPRRGGFVSPHWLARQSSSGIRLLEVGYGARAAFLAAHIGGADYLDTSELEQEGSWRKVSDASLMQTLLAHGIRHDSVVVLYGRNNLAAARAAHLMLYAGVRDVRLLDGGFAQWNAHGLPVASGAPACEPPASSFGAPFPAHPALLTSIAQVRHMLASSAGTLVSVRSHAEFTGATSGYGPHVARGDIPGALWGQAGEDGDVNSMSAYLQADGAIKPLAEIAAMWRAQGIAGKDATVFYCGTGWRASFAFYVAWLMRWPNISVYEGGWFEYAQTAQV